MEMRESDRSIRAAEGQAKPSGKGTDARAQPAEETGPARVARKDLLTILREIANKAAADKSHRFGGLFHLLNEAFLKECFGKLKKNAAPGIDGVTVQEYEKDLEKNIHELVERL